MKHYKLTLSVSLVEVSNFDGPEAETPPAEIEPASIDPVERDDKQINRVFSLLEKQIGKMTPRATVQQPPKSMIELRKMYDVPAESVEAAAAMLRKFEGVAEELGMPTDVPGPFVRAMYVGG